MGAYYTVTRWLLQDGCCGPGVLEAAGLAGRQGSAGQGANVVSAPSECPTKKMVAAGLESSRLQVWLAGSALLAGVLM